jgi:hypothetical protein
LVRRNPPGVELLDATELIRLQAGGVSDYFLDEIYPPLKLLVKTCTGKQIFAGCLH